MWACVVHASHAETDVLKSNSVKLVQAHQSCQMKQVAHIKSRVLSESGKRPCKGMQCMKGSAMYIVTCLCSIARVSG